MNGKGSGRRPETKEENERYCKNYQRVFNKKDSVEKKQVSKVEPQFLTCPTCDKKTVHNFAENYGYICEECGRRFT